MYAYILMECANCGRFLRGDLTQGFLRVKNGKRPCARRADMASEIVSFCLTAESSLYKYMRIYLWGAISNEVLG